MEQSDSDYETCASEPSVSEIATSAKKVMIADAVLSAEATPSQMARRYHVKSRTVSRWAYRRKNHQYLKLGDGRPRCLDEISLNNLMAVMETNEGMENDDIRWIIRQEHYDSYLRRVELTGEIRKYKAMSLRSVVRYVISLKKGELY